MELSELKEKKVAELREIANVLKIEGAAKMKKKQLLDVLFALDTAEKNRKAENSLALDNSDPGNSEAGESEAEKTEPADIRDVNDVSPEDDKSAKPSAEKNESAKPRAKVRKAAEVRNIRDVNDVSPEDCKSAKPSAEKNESAKPRAKVRKAAEVKDIRDVNDVSPEDCKSAKPSAEETESLEPRTEEPYTAVIMPAETKPEEEPKAKDDTRYDTTGILDIAEGGFGFLRYDNFLSSDKDVYVSPTQIRRFNLKTGDEIFGVARKPVKDDHFGALLYVHSVNGDEPGKARTRKDYSDLTPIYPTERICLEKGSSTLSMRLTDLVAPIGKGQRGLIVAPPKAGKTTLLKQIATAIEKQNTNAELIVLLIDERPEEVTDMQRSINGRVIYSTFDEQPSHHVKVAEMVLARAQRLVEHGRDVIILMDSITRLARAYNLVEPSSGRTLSGGLDPAALYKPKKFFGAARNIEEGGSITILATALVETGSRMDDMIFEEFKGTGNMELHLDRKLQEKRIFPAINLNKSGTRREDLLISSEELEAVWLMRRAVADWGIAEATEKVVMDLCHTKTNRDFIQLFKKTRI